MLLVTCHSLFAVHVQLSIEVIIFHQFYKIPFFSKTYQIWHIFSGFIQIFSKFSYPSFVAKLGEFSGYSSLFKFRQFWFCPKIPIFKILHISG